jgi:hypothetical protein
MDKQTGTVLMIVGTIVVILLGVFIWITMRQPVVGTDGTPTTTPNGATTTPQTPPTSATSSVMIALLDTAGNSSGKSRGCDKVVMVPWRVATTTAPLTAAMLALFNTSTTTFGNWFNYIDRTNETLKFDRATVVNGTANIYLTGSLSGMAGVCDDPRAAIQIEETALQFPTVQRVQIYLNNATTTLVPSQR